MDEKFYALLLEDVRRDAELLQEKFLQEGFLFEMDVVLTEKEYVAALLRGGYDIIFAD